MSYRQCKFMLSASPPCFDRTPVTLLDACIWKFTPPCYIFCNVRSCAIPSLYVCNFRSAMYFFFEITCCFVCMLVRIIYGPIFNIFLIFSSLHSHFPYSFFIVVSAHCLFLVFMHNVAAFSCQLCAIRIYLSLA